MVQWKWMYVPLVVTMWHHLNIQPFSIEPRSLKLFWETKNSPSQTFLNIPKRFLFPNENTCASVPFVQRQAPKTKAGGHGKPSFTEALISNEKKGEKRGGVGWLGGLESFHDKMPFVSLEFLWIFCAYMNGLRDDTERENHPLGFFLGGNNFGISRVFWM